MKTKVLFIGTLVALSFFVSCNSDEKQMAELLQQFLTMKLLLLLKLMPQLKM